MSGKPLPPIEALPAAQYAAALHTLNNVLEYTVGETHKLITIRALTPKYAKAISSTRKTEFYFPFEYLRLREGGGFLRIKSVLRREDRNAPIEWNSDGLPVRNAKLIDDMKQLAGNTWRQGFFSKHVSQILTIGKIAP